MSNRNGQPAGDSEKGKAGSKHPQSSPPPNKEAEVEQGQQTPESPVGGDGDNANAKQQQQEGNLHEVEYPNEGVKTKRAMKRGQMTYIGLVCVLGVLVVSSTVSGGVYQHKKAELRTRRSEFDELEQRNDTRVDCAFTWQEWSDCDQTCAVKLAHEKLRYGVKMRQMTVTQNASEGGVQCPDPVESVECNTFLCPTPLTQLKWEVSDLGCGFDGQKLKYRVRGDATNVIFDSTSQDEIYKLIPCDED